MPSWFIRVEAIKAQLLECNAQTAWVPAYVKEKRFQNWLETAHDWAVSRSRFWGTPLPIWTSADGAEVRVIGSVAELEAASGAKARLGRLSVCGRPASRPASLRERRVAGYEVCAADGSRASLMFVRWAPESALAGQGVAGLASARARKRAACWQVTDLHRHFIDHLTFPDAAGTGVLRRVDEVFDCWFESGSMPYGQVHYPFKDKEGFEAQFPADFVAEGAPILASGYSLA